MLIPKDGCEFIVADFSAIEARVLAWEAEEQWVLDAFQNGEDLYCATASQMFHVPVVKHGINGDLRQKGKIATLACGYGGSSGALISMGALQMGLNEGELPEIIDSWREANPKIVQYWWDTEKAAMTAYKTGERQEVGKIAFEFYSGTLWMVLPSGRRLAYLKPRQQPNRFGRMSLTYEGVGQNHKWSRQETYSGRLVENATQAIARDILAEAMDRISAEGLEPVDDANHIIMDYSIHDAIEAGFNHVVFIIRKDIEKEFEEVIGERIASICSAHNVTVDYAFQDINDIPGELPAGRTKPWGTGQAVLAAKNVIDTPFIVINADDYYGKEGFKAVHEYLVNGGKSYNGPQEIDHLFPMNREHGKINQRKREESILCHEGNTHRNLRQKSFWRYSRESGSWEPLLRRTI